MNVLLISFSMIIVVVGAVVQNPLDPATIDFIRNLDNEWITKKAILGVSLPVENKTIAVGEELSLHCEIGGIPTPAVRWAHNGVTIGYESPINFEEKLLNRGREPTETGIMAVALTIPCAQPSHSGVYSCFGFNGHTMVESSAEVIVEGSTKECQPEPHGAPKIVAHTDTRAENQGNTATLVCSSDIPAHWTWTFEGRDITEQKGRYQIKSHGSLMIHNIVFADLGAYYCTASNEFGNSTAETYLHVTSSHS